ncbi:hypothetical protein ES705_22529 [subsurface metagenome]
MSFYDNSDEKGDRAERKVRKILEKLEKRGVIESFGWTTPSSGDDLLGIDILIFPIVLFMVNRETDWQFEHHQKKGV